MDNLIDTEQFESIGRCRPSNLWIDCVQAAKLDESDSITIHESDAKTANE